MNPTSIQSESAWPLNAYEPEGASSGRKQTLAVLIPILIGIVLGTASSYFIIRQEWLWLIALVLLIPAVALQLVYPFISVLIWLVLFPFFLQEFMPGARYIYWMLHRLMIPAALGTTVLLHLLGARKIQPKRFGWVDLAIVAFITLSLVNILLLTDQPISRFVRFYDRLFIPFCFYWLMRFTFPREQELKWLVTIAIMIVLSQGAIGLFSWFAPNLLPVVWLGRIGERTVGTFNNPAVYSTTLMFCVLILMQTAQSGKVFWQRMVAFITIGAAFFFIFFSFSRGSWLGALVVLVGLTILFPKTIIKLSLVIGLVALIVILAAPLDGYLAYAKERLFTQNTTESRIITGAASYRMIQAKPLQGWGYGNHEFYDEQFKDAVMGLMSKAEQSSHNTYLLIAAEMGIPGLLLYLFPVVWLLLLSLKYHRWIPKGGMMGRSMLFMLWSLIAAHFLAGSFTDLIQSNFFNTMIWWFALAWIANLIDTARANKDIYSGRGYAYGK